MIEYATRDDAGRVLGFGAADELPALTGARTAVALAAPKAGRGFPRGATPTEVLHIDGAGALYWVETATLDEIKACKSAEINAAYQLANKTSFTFAGKEIQANEHSMNQIQVTNGYVAITGGLHPSFPMAWKTLDNGYVAIPDVATWREFYGAIAQTGQDNFDKAQRIKAEIDAAITPEEVAAIQWNQPPEAV